MSLLASLGLDSVSADPNAIPDGRYPGVVMQSAYVHTASKDTVSHVITYQVNEGGKSGAQRQEWFEIGKSPVFDAAGNITAITPSMGEDRKTWYKKRLVDLGVVEETISTTFEPEHLVGKNVLFGVKTNAQGYQNINFVELRQGNAPVNVPPTGETATPSAGGLAGVSL